MKTDRLSDTMLLLGAGATAILVWTAVRGYALAGDEGLRDHLLFALLAVFLLTLAHGWVVIFLLSSRWAVRSSLATVPTNFEAEAAAIRRRVVPFALAALLLLIANFVLGGRTYTGGFSAGTHQALSWLTIAVQVVALLAAQRGLRRYSGLLADLEGAARQTAEGA